MRLNSHQVKYLMGVLFMKNESNKKNKTEMKKEENLTKHPKTTDGINSPEIAPPAFNPPVPNRAWTEMRNREGK